MATRDATCIAPGFGKGNGREKMEKRENGIWGLKTGKWDGIWGYFPVFPSTSRFFSNQCIFKLPGSYAFDRSPRISERRPVSAAR
jgi:hypothetical protein